MALGQRVRKLQANLKEEQGKTKNASLTKVKQSEEDDEEREIMLRSGAAAGSPGIRKLKAGEAFLAKDAPIEEQPPSRMVVCARAMEDGRQGWISWSGGAAPLKPCKPRYVCTIPLPLTMSKAESTDTVRQAEIGEVFEVAEGPTLDSSSGVRRIRCASKGMIVGWATIRSSDGEQMLEVK